MEGLVISTQGTILARLNSGSHAAPWPGLGSPFPPAAVFGNSSLLWFPIGTVWVIAPVLQGFVRKQTRKGI